MEGVPSPEKQSPSVESDVEKQETIERAQAIYAEMQHYKGDVDRDGWERLRDLSAALKEELGKLPWSVKVQNGLPWNPRDELEQAANDTHLPVAEAA